MTPLKELLQGLGLGCGGGGGGGGLPLPEGEQTQLLGGCLLLLRGWCGGGGLILKNIRSKISGAKYQEK